MVLTYAVFRPVSHKERIIVDFVIRPIPTLGSGCEYRIAIKCAINRLFNCIIGINVRVRLRKLIVPARDYVRAEFIIKRNAPIRDNRIINRKRFVNVLFIDIFGQVGNRAVAVPPNFNIQQFDNRL